MLIDPSYFAAGPRQILNLTLGNGTTEEHYAVNQYIEEYQEEFLYSALGEEVAELVLSELEERDASYQYEVDKDIESICAKLRKPFADYVLYNILRDTNDTAGITGTVRVKSPNEHVSPLHRQVSTWNRMCNRLHVFAEWVDSGECPIEGVYIDSNLLTPINALNL